MKWAIEMSKVLGAEYAYNNYSYLLASLRFNSLQALPSNEMYEITKKDNTKKPWIIPARTALNPEWLS